jgi:hypothetical protein
MFEQDHDREAALTLNESVKRNCGNCKHVAKTCLTLLCLFACDWAAEGLSHKCTNLGIVYFDTCLRHLRAYENGEEINSCRGWES